MLSFTPWEVAQLDVLVAHMAGALLLVWQGIHRSYGAPENGIHNWVTGVVTPISRLVFLLLTYRDPSRRATENYYKMTLCSLPSVMWLKVCHGVTGVSSLTKRVRREYLGWSLEYTSEIFNIDIRTKNDALDLVSPFKDFCFGYLWKISRGYHFQGQFWCEVGDERLQ